MCRHLPGVSLRGTAFRGGAHPRCYEALAADLRREYQRTGSRNVSVRSNPWRHVRNQPGQTTSPRARRKDNEQWHLLILEELIANSGKRENRIYYFWIPQAIALVYYQISWLLFVLKPKWSYGLNADFEDHAEHEYM